MRVRQVLKKASELEKACVISWLARRVVTRANQRREHTSDEHNFRTEHPQPWFLLKCWPLLQPSWPFPPPSPPPARTQAHPTSGLRMGGFTNHMTQHRTPPSFCKGWKRHDKADGLAPGSRRIVLLFVVTGGPSSGRVFSCWRSAASWCSHGSPGVPCAPQAQARFIPVRVRVRHQPLITCQHLCVRALAFSRACSKVLFDTGSVRPPLNKHRGVCRGAVNTAFGDWAAAACANFCSAQSALPRGRIPCRVS